MMRLAVALTALLIAATDAAVAVPDSACNVAAQHAYSDFRLSHVAKAIAEKNLNIVVLGSASSVLPNSNGVSQAYPARLEAALAKKLPASVKVSVRSIAKARETAAEMERALPRILAADKPALVIWQTGTVEAIRRTGIDDFSIVLGEGIDLIHAAGADIILMNQQYSPRTELMFDAPQYADAMRIVALQHEIPLFDRFAIMRHWGEMGVFDFNEVTKKSDMAARVHNCIGLLLASQVLDGVRLPRNFLRGN